MKWFKEISGGDHYPNHIYLLSDSKTEMFAYVKVGTNVVKKFVEPYRFHIRGRKFVEVPNKWNFDMGNAKPAGRSFDVVGSKGDKYVVAENANGEWSCSCPGFQYRATCKHIEEQKAK